MTGGQGQGPFERPSHSVQGEGKWEGEWWPSWIKQRGREKRVGSYLSR
jgi:hypothetical protein